MKKLSESVEEDEEKKLSASDLSEFLKRNKRDNKKVFAKISDMAQWKKKHRVDPSTKVFIVSGGYKTIKNSLIERGWFRNQDIKSNCYDLKWVLKGKDIDFKTLQEQ